LRPYNGPAIWQELDPQERLVLLDYLARRTFQLLLIIVVAITINFGVPRLLPGDPVEAALQRKIAVSGNVSADVEKVAALYRSKFGLDKPLYVQYLNYWNDLIHFNLGVSLVDFPQTVSSKISAAVPWTVGLLAVSTIVAFGVGSVLGALLAWPRTPAFVHLLVPGLMIVSAVPFFLLGLVLIFLFVVVIPLFPPGGGFDPVAVMGFNFASAVDIGYHALLPAISLVLGAAGFWALGMRSLMVSVLGEDYITFAEAKGLPSTQIFLWYGMRNALLPQITSLAIALGSIVSGTVLVEAIFNYPGLGGLLYASITGKDYFVIQGIVVILVLALGVALFVVDLIYPLVDPRIRYQ
jgi:peptide/nickel transport system permease protein